MLTVSEGGRTYMQQMSGPYAGETYHLSPDPTSGTLITLGAAPCFCAGTRIATERGMIAVEALSPGDRVHTLPDGTLRPVTWLGHRHVDCRRCPDPAQVWPIRVRAGAFARGRPCRDLRLSPDHAIFVVGTLIPIRYLINGRTVVQEPREAVTYWHIELAQHSVVVAEGVPAETYLDTGNRAAFESDGDTVVLRLGGVRSVASAGRLLRAHSGNRASQARDPEAGIW